MNRTLEWHSSRRALQPVFVGDDARSRLGSCFFLLAVLLGASAALAATYQPPLNPRQDINLDSGWRFIRQDVAGAEQVGFDDSGWTVLDLPHTWNNLDGQDGGNNYYRGIGWYRRHCPVDGSDTNRELFLKFDGANTVSDVYVNGNFVGEHRGGYAAFVFDVTPYLNPGADNVIAVKVSNASFADVAPQSADFTFFGGIYRDVHLLVLDRLDISPLDYGSPGVYLETTNVSAGSADLNVTTVVSNAYPTPRTATVRAFVVDAATNIVKALTNVVTLPAGSVSNVTAAAVISNPHLWDGLNDPYLYHVYVELSDGTNLTDWIRQPLGFRWLTFDPDTGVMLNGHPYDLHGVNMHQDWLNRGWAIGSPERHTNFMFIKEIGATMVRLCHYEHDDETYQLADEDGVMLWSEIPYVNGAGSSTNFTANTERQLIELIRQRRNHPSVICWGVFNEVNNPTTDGPIVSNLVNVVHREDPTRPATAASHSGISASYNWMPDITGFNEYYGWYGGTTADFATFLDNLHAAYPTRVVGISEYGAGASIIQHSEDPLTPPPPYGSPHPEEWQNKFHEDYWRIMKTRPYLWCKLVWNLFDFAVDSRNEGDTPGRNDKGLVTYDRKVRKDAFYFYKANWTTNPMVYITGHTFTNRLTNAITAKVYANCDSVELFLNGASQGTRGNTNDIFTWPVTLAMGSNYVQAVGTKGSITVTDSLAWLAPVPPPVVSVVSPAGAAASLRSTSDNLQISVQVSNPVPANPLTTTWSQVAGPGLALFASSNAPTTSVSFSSDGIYSLAFTANNGAATSVFVLVFVNTDSRITNGLAAWWKMDENGGSTAADSSGNGRDAAVVNGTFTGGTIGNALQFTSASSRATYAAQESNQVTVAAWVRCDTTGGGNFPRIVNGQSYRLMFRFSSSDVNSVGFATEDSNYGDWDSGGGTISLGTWFHVAVTYDRSDLANLPVFYINGLKYPTVTLAMPSGAPPAFSGTGYIGNNAALNRAWNGLIDDLRIYDRVLSPVEIQALAAVPPSNLAPVVSAGSDQTLVWPAMANLAGSASDDGQPNPPAALTTTWSQLNGPGTVTFGNANALATTASFSSPGTYQLQLAADDGQATTVSRLALEAVTRPPIAFQSFPGVLQLSWQTTGGIWHLQSQTNPVTSGLGTNWADVPGSSTTNRMDLPVDPANGCVFYRLTAP